MQNKEKVTIKPEVVRMEELKQNVVKAINESQLPIYIVEPIMNELWQQTRAMNENFKEQQIAAYYNALQNTHQNQDGKGEESSEKNNEKIEVAPVQPDEQDD